MPTAPPCAFHFEDSIMLAAMQIGLACVTLAVMQCGFAWMWSRQHDTALPCYEHNGASACTVVAVTVKDICFEFRVTV